MRLCVTLLALSMAFMVKAQGAIDVHSHIITPEFVSALEGEGILMDEGFPLPKSKSTQNSSKRISPLRKRFSRRASPRNPVSFACLPHR